MSKNAQLHDEILENAGELFRKQGYAATSMKQIAQAAGCTNAALYYYFEGGKRHILREVIRGSAVGDPPQGLAAALTAADSLESFIIQLSQALSENLPQMTDRVNWLMLQFPTLPAEEKRYLQDRTFFGFHSMVRAHIARFVTDETRADELAWLIFCAFFGHHQIFSKLGVGERVDLSLEKYGRLLAQTIGADTP